MDTTTDNGNVHSTTADNNQVDKEKPNEGKQANVVEEQKQQQVAQEEQHEQQKTVGKKQTL